MEKAFNERPQGVLPSNTIPNPQEDIKVITTRNGMTLAGPSVPPPPLSSSSKEVERDPAAIIDQVHISSSESTTHVSSTVVQPSIDSKSNKILKQNPHRPPIPYPSILNKDKLRDKFDIQIHKFLQMFKKLHFNIIFAEAKFLIPCDFNELEECMALADMGASINLMPLSVWKKLMLPELVPTRMTLELANRSFAYPAGIAEDVFVHVVDVDGEELTLKVGDENLIFNVESTLKYPHKHGDESINQIYIIDTTFEDYFYEVLNIQKLIHPLSGYPTPSSDLVVASLSPSLTPFGDSDFLLEEINTLLALDDSILHEIDDGIFDLEGDILLFEKLLINDSTKDLPSKELKNDEMKMTKSLIEEPRDLELKELPPHLEGIDHNFCTHKILMEDDFKPDVQHQRRVNPKIHEDIKAELIKLLDAGLIYPISDSPWVSPVHVVPKKGGMTSLSNKERWYDDTSKFLSIPKTRRKPLSPALIGHLLTVGAISSFASPRTIPKVLFSSFLPPILEMILKRFEDTNLVLNWEKCHFMVKEGIVLGHKISKNGIEVDRAKVDVIAKLPPPTKYLKKKLTEDPILMAPDWDLPFKIMCDASDFAVGEILGQQKKKYFQPIHYAGKTLYDAQTHYTTTEKELLDVLYAFKKFRSYIVLSKTIVYTDHSALKYLSAKQDAKPRLLRWILFLQ
ncbi:reverse transcriptase domain-containing protein [Tanacetum coccineum]